MQDHPTEKDLDASIEEEESKEAEKVEKPPPVVVHLAPLELKGEHP